jgi:hypothetical protein
MDWTLPFDTNLPFVDDLLLSTSAADLARTLTTADEVDFSTLTRQNIAEESPVVLNLHAKWHTLSLAVWECCTALPHLVRYIQDCAEVSAFLVKLNQAVSPRVDCPGSLCLPCNWALINNNRRPFMTSETIIP